VADAYTPSTEDTKIIIAVKERILFFYLQIPVYSREIDFGKLYLLYYVLQLTAPIIRA
jgi:hypothetical protein